MPTTSPIISARASATGPATVNALETSRQPIVIELRLVVDAPTLVRAVTSNGLVARPHDEALLIIRADIRWEAGEDINVAVEARLRGEVIASRSFPAAAAIVSRTDDLLHIDLADHAGHCLLSLSAREGADGQCDGPAFYARSGVPGLLGLPGGRYDPPEARIQQPEI